MHIVRKILENWFPALLICLFAFIGGFVFFEVSPDGRVRPFTVSVYRDRDTGCQYVGADGALTPRLDRAGKQVCL